MAKTKDQRKGVFCLEGQQNASFLRASSMRKFD